MIVDGTRNKDVITVVKQNSTSLLQDELKREPYVHNFNTYSSLEIGMLQGKVK